MSKTTGEKENECVCVLRGGCIRECVCLCVHARTSFQAGTEIHFLLHPSLSEGLIPITQVEEYRLSKDTQ